MLNWYIEKSYVNVFPQVKMHSLMTQGFDVCE
jgi:hypothetical protein